MNNVLQVLLLTLRMLKASFGAGSTHVGETLTGDSMCTVGVVMLLHLVQRDM